MFKREVIFSGGLGNQMFQYAFLLSLRKAGINCVMNNSLYGNIHMHNGYELQKVFGINETSNFTLPAWLVKVITKYFHFDFICRDKVIVYNPEVFSLKYSVYLGCWINENYFRDISINVRNAFNFQDISRRNLLLAEEMDHRNSVSIHIRRGDYLKNPIYNVCNEGYYKKAIEFMNNSIDSPHYYVFSDDPDWCSNFMKQLSIPFTILDRNKGVDSYQDMYLMTKCKNNIIANSTFSWWGAWLNDNSQKIVVAPSLWFTNSNLSPICETWHKINVNL